MRKKHIVVSAGYCGFPVDELADPLGTININLHSNVVDFSCTVNTADIDKTVDLGQMAYDTITERWSTALILLACGWRDVLRVQLRFYLRERRHPIPTCTIWMIPQYGTNRRHRIT